MGPKIGSKIATEQTDNHNSTSAYNPLGGSWKAMVFESGGWRSDRWAGGGVVRRGKLRRRIVNYRLRGNAFLTPDLGTQAFLGHFLGGANNFFLPKVNPVLPKNILSGGGQILQFCSAKQMYHSFVSQCSASINIGQKLVKDD